MQSVKADGTHLGKGGSGIYYICLEEFGKGKKVTKYLARHQFVGMDKDNQAMVEYFINEKKVGKEEFDLYE